MGKHNKQLKLEDYFGEHLDNNSNTSQESMEATGDELISKPASSICFAFQNINGLSLREGLSVMPEVATIGSLQVDFTGFSETNLHWNRKARDALTNQLHSHVGYNKIECASNVSTKYSNGYQPGGVMLAVIGPQRGRVLKSGSDPWGRFSWMEL